MAEACASLKSWGKHGPMESFQDSRLLLLLSMETTFPLHRHGYVSTKPRSLSSRAQSQNAFFQALCIEVGTCYSSGLHFQAWTQEGCLIPSPLSCVHLQGSEGANINGWKEPRSLSHHLEEVTQGTHVTCSGHCKRKKLISTLLAH